MVSNSQQSFRLGFQQYEIDNSFLSALTAELVFQIPEELSSNKSFIKNSDLLDK